MTTRQVLRAEDADDLGIISARLQDAVFKIGDVAYLKAKRRFVVMLNRFMWEEAVDTRSGGAYRRIRSGLHFEDVLKVQSQGVRRDAADAIAELLSISFEPKEDGAGAITLVLAGGGAIRLDVECIDAELADIGEPWATAHKPAHDGVD